MSGASTKATNDQERSARPRYQPLVILAAAVSTGIVADRLAALPVGLCWFAALGGWLAWILLRRRTWDRTAALPLLVAAAACGAAWHHCRWNLLPDDDLGFSARSEEQPACVEALALTGSRWQPPPEPSPLRPVQRGERTRVEVELVAVRDRAEWRQVSGRARLVVEGQLAGVRPGDRIRVFCQLSAPRPAYNPGEFDYAAYTRADRTRSILRSENPACVSIVEDGSLLRPSRWLEAMRRHGDRLFWRNLDPHRAGLASAVLLGCREEVAAEQTEAFMETGTIHVLSISGLHVGILAATLSFLMRTLCVRRVVTAIVVASITAIYTVLTDAEPPAVRAMILVLVMCAAYCLDRRPLSLNSLAAAALVVLVLNPADLFRVGVQLSFLCVIVLFWFSSHPLWGTKEQDPLRQLVWESRSLPVRMLGAMGRWAWEMSVLGAMIWLVTLPLVMARFHLLSPSAVVLNTLLAPATAMALWSGLGMLLLGPAPLVGGVFAWCCDKTFWLLESIIDAARMWTASHFWVPGPPDWWLTGLYAGLAVLAVFPRLRPPRRWCIALAALWISVGLLAGMLLRGHDRLTATFLAIDHGCSVILELPSGETLLYDAGRFSSPEMATQSIAAALWSKGIMHVDAVVLSHADSDHYNALPGLLDRFSVGVVYVSPVMFENPNEALEVLQSSIRRAKAPVREISAGDRLRGGEGCLLEVTHPPRKGILGSENANSIVLAVEYRGKRILLPGDLESPGLHDLVAEEPWHCDILLAPHHGSRRSDPVRLAKWASPAWVIIGGSHRLDVRPTVAAYQARGSAILHSGRVGCVEATIDGQGLRVDSLLKD